MAKSTKAKGAAPLPEPVENTGTIPVVDTPAPDEITDTPAPDATNDTPAPVVNVHIDKLVDKIIIDTPAPDEITDTPAPEYDPFLETLSSYAASYPEEKEFHVTSDGQVFLKKNARYAKDHQATINKDAEVKIYSVE